MKFIFIFLIRLYQTFISPLLGPRCRFYPSCSQYALESFQHYGFFVGFYKSVWRILRCNPLSEGGFDPAVPENENHNEHGHACAHVHHHSIAGGRES